jgi:hypothetical protein
MEVNQEVEKDPVKAREAADQKEAAVPLDKYLNCQCKNALQKI